MELLHELVPAATRIGVLAFRGGLGTSQDLASIESAAKSIGVEPITTLVSSDMEFKATFADFARAKVGAVLINDTRYFDVRRSQIVGLCMDYRLPAVSLPREFAVAGGLASYGSDLNDGLTRAGVYVGRILKGEKPADLPVAQPTKFDLVINLKTARALDLAVPPALLLRADEVIE